MDEADEITIKIFPAKSFTNNLNPNGWWSRLSRPTQQSWGVPCMKNLRADYTQSRIFSRALTCPSHYCRSYT